MREIIVGEEPSGGYVFAYVHGDFAPWNFKNFEGQLFITDWERFEPYGPAYVDILYFYISYWILVRHKNITITSKKILEVFPPMSQKIDKKQFLLSLYYLGVNFQIGGFVQKVAEKVTEMWLEY